MSEKFGITVKVNFKEDKFKKEIEKLIQNEDEVDKLYLDDNGLNVKLKNNDEIFTYNIIDFMDFQTETKGE